MKVHKKGIVAFGAMAVISTLTLAGCSSSSAAPAGGDSAEAEFSGQITVWADTNRAEVLQDAADKFTDDTGVKVTIVEKQFDEVRTQFVQQVPTGKGPDIAVGAHDWLGELVTNGVVAPVELGDRASEFQQVAVDAWSYEGQTYGIPYAIENIALLRNTDLAPEAATDFDDMIAKGQASGAKYPFIVGLDPEASDPYHLYPFQTSFGAPVFGTDADGAYDPTDLQIGNAGGEAFAAWLTAQGAAGVLNTNMSPDIAKESFFAGDSPFYLTGPWNATDAIDAGLNIAIDEIPSAGDQAAQPFAGVQGFFLSAESENRLAANEFLLNYIGSEEVQTALYEVGGRAPALTSSYEAAVEIDPIIAGFGKVGENAVPMPSVPEMGAVWEYWGVTEVALINGQGDPAALWTKMASDIQAAIG